MKKNLFYVFAFILIGFILSDSGAVMHYTREAMDMCYEFIIPSLFPFFVCSGLLIYSGFTEVIARWAENVMRPLFNVAPSGAAAFVLGIISGFPSGAICAAQLYKSSNLSKAEAERLLAFSNNCGPLFIIGTLGVSVFSSPVHGAALYIIHIISSIIVGIVFRNWNKGRHISPPTHINTDNITLSEAMSNAVTKSASSIITVCFSIIFFSAISRALLDLFPMPPVLYAIVSGLCEFSGGVLKISSLDISISQKLVLSSLIVGFSGFCVHLQVMAVTAGAGLSLKPYLLGKCLHAITAAVITAAAVWIWSPYLSVGTFKSPVLSSAFAMSALFCAFAVAVIGFICLALKMLSPHLQDKASRKHKQVRHRAH